MGLYLALDAGGTGTRCWLAEDERVLAAAECGTVKLMNVGEQVATERISGLLEKVARGGGIRLEGVTRTCLGMAGVSSPAARAWAERVLGERVGGELVVMGDEGIALDAAFRGGPGILVIAGTGSHVVGRCADGTRATAGGWGPLIGDEGSGTWIGMEALRAGLRAQDRGIGTCLLREIESFWGLGSLGELVGKANQRPRPDFAELAVVVARCAEGGDALAESVLERAGEELAAQVSLVASKMHAAGCPAGDARRVAFTGSVLGKIERVRRSFREHVWATIAGVQVADEPVEPLEGALWRARGGV